ncbi:hypothetical protein FJZ27_03150 [Candidatus Peribacteria bacterium]|nr:hypothetical protein [Candidatus Peribacteria bacterium]
MRTHWLIMALTLTLAACGQGDSADPPAQAKAAENASAELGMEALHALTDGSIASRPGGPLGIYVSAYLAQGIFVRIESALDGIEAGKKMIGGQGATGDETFSLLQALGNVLQIALEDTLNRSPNRRKALDEYVQSLRNVFALSERKMVELTTAIQTLEEEERTKRKETQEIQREIDKAMENEDYTAVGARQAELTERQTALAALTTRREQTASVKKIFEDLIAVAKERIIVIESNRVILIAGLKVIKLPGIEDLHILLDSGKAHRETRSTFGTDAL